MSTRDRLEPPPPLVLPPPDFPPPPLPASAAGTSASAKTSRPAMNVNRAACVLLVTIKHLLCLDVPADARRSIDYKPFSSLTARFPLTHPGDQSVQKAPP